MALAGQHQVQVMGKPAGRAPASSGGVTGSASPDRQNRRYVALQWIVEIRVHGPSRPERADLGQRVQLVGTL